MKQKDALEELSSYNKVKTLKERDSYLLEEPHLCEVGNIEQEDLMGKDCKQMSGLIQDKDTEYNHLLIMKDMGLDLKKIDDSLNPFFISTENKLGVDATNKSIAEFLLREFLRMNLALREFTNFKMLHNDIKPANILIEPSTFRIRMKLRNNDNFGSDNRLEVNEKGKMTLIDLGMVETYENMKKGNKVYLQKDVRYVFYPPESFLISLLNEYEENKVMKILDLLERVISNESEYDHQMDEKDEFQTKINKGQFTTEEKEMSLIIYPFIHNLFVETPDNKHWNEYFGDNKSPFYFWRKDLNSFELKINELKSIVSNFKSQLKNPEIDLQTYFLDRFDTYGMGISLYYLIHKSLVRNNFVVSIDPKENTLNLKKTQPGMDNKFQAIVSILLICCISMFHPLLKVRPSPLDIYKFLKQNLSETLGFDKNQVETIVNKMNETA